MKFKLLKSQHHSYFNMLKLIDKTSLSLRENKTIKDDSLIFFTKNNKLHIYTGNNVQSAYFNLNIDIESDDYFAVDSNVFNTAFNNFPTDEINFLYDPDKNTLIFGNKKTKVALNTSACKSIDFIDTFIEKQGKLKPVNNLLDAIKYTSFSCSLHQEEYPYSEIMLSIDTDFFSAHSSDKHRISFYGSFEKGNSYLISKTFADVIANYLKEYNNSNHFIENNTIYICNDFYKLGTTLQKNNYEDIFEKFLSFKTESEVCCNFILNKSSIVKSLKFISSVSGNDVIDFTFDDNQILLSGNTNSKGVVADKITLNVSLPSLSSSYVQNHLIKALDVIDSENIDCNILNYNDYYILNINHNNFSHLIFPMG